MMQISAAAWGNVCVRGLIWPGGIVLQVLLSSPSLIKLVKAVVSVIRLLEIVINVTHFCILSLGLTDCVDVIRWTGSVNEHRTWFFVFKYGWGVYCVCSYYVFVTAEGKSESLLPSKWSAAGIRSGFQPLHFKNTQTTSLTSLGLYTSL